MKPYKPGSIFCSNDNLRVGIAKPPGSRDGTEALVSGKPALESLPTYLDPE